MAWRSFNSFQELEVLQPDELDGGVVGVDVECFNSFQELEVLQLTDRGILAVGGDGFQFLSGIRSSPTRSRA